MPTEIIHQSGAAIAVLTPGVPYTSASDILDTLISARYETGADRFVLDKHSLPESFFILSSGLAGEVLQKIVNYRMKIAIYGDYSRYTSKPLQDFIRESNKGHDVFFPTTKDEAVLRLAQA